MHRKLSLVALFFCAFAFGLLGKNVHAESSVYIHFFVVPAAAEEGKDLTTELSKLREQLVVWAGGYTELGASQGGSREPDGKVHSEDNLSFIVSAPTDITIELGKYISQHFATKRPFILVWQGKCSL